jgi:hypothetical protein
MPTYRGPYSPDDPDFKKPGKNLASYPNRNPRIVGGAYGPPDGGPFNGAIDCSGTIDRQVKYGFGFDDNKNADWSSSKSDDGSGGFTGDVLPKLRGDNHPKKGSV